MTGAPPLTGRAEGSAPRPQAYAAEPHGVRVASEPSQEPPFGVRASMWRQRAGQRRRHRFIVSHLERIPVGWNQSGGKLGLLPPPNQTLACQGLVTLKICRKRASPQPAGGGLGRGVARMAMRVRQSRDPHPQPLPTTSRACPTCALKHETRAGPGFVGRGAHRVRCMFCIKSNGTCSRHAGKDMFTGCRRRTERAPAPPAAQAGDSR